MSDLSFASLLAGIRQVFADEGVNASVVLGERELGKQMNQGGAAARASRIVIVPIGGDYEKPMNNGGNPKPVADFLHVSEVHVWGYDPSAPNDEAKQYDAAIALHNWLLVALRRFAWGQVKWSKAQWTRVPVERVFGRELVLQLETRFPVKETPWPEANGVTADKTVTIVLPHGDVPGC